MMLFAAADPSIPGDPGEVFPTCLRRPCLFSHKRKDRGEKSAWTRLVRAAGAIQVSTNFLVAANTHTHPAGAMVRAACYGTPDLNAAAFEQLGEISFAVKIFKTVRFCRDSVGADAHIGPLGSYGFAEDFRKNGAFCRVDVGIDPYKSLSDSVENPELLQASREKSRKTEAVFPESTIIRAGEQKCDDLGVLRSAENISPVHALYFFHASC